MTEVAKAPRRRRWRWLGVAALALVVVAAVCVARATLFARARIVPVPPPEQVELESLALSRRLAGALRIRTIASAAPDALEIAAFDDMVRYLADGFARAHEALEVERPSDASLLYTWRGSDPAL